MADPNQKYLRTEYPGGKVILSNIINHKTGEFETYRKITTYPDGSSLTGKVDGGVIRKLGNEYFEKILTTPHVSYEMFNTVGDGVTDDTEKIRLCHMYANVKNLSVVNKAGEYCMGTPVGIEIQTNVDWGNTVFHILEETNKKTGVGGIDRFIVSPKNQWQINPLDSDNKALFLSNHKTGISKNPALEDYPDSYMIIVNDDDKMYRYGDTGGDSIGKTDLFYISEGGHTVGDHIWAYSDYTELRIIKLEDYLTIKGGIFKLNGVRNPDFNNQGYTYGGIMINRSRTRLKNVVFQFEEGMVDNFQPASRGLIKVYDAYDVAVSDVRVPPRYNRNSSGTYSLYNTNAYKLKYSDVIGEGSSDSWGVMAGETLKDFYLERCDVNRIDTHSMVWGLDIIKCNVGTGGIRLNGGGALNVENTSGIESESGAYINFREDWGSVWDGSIRIITGKQYVTDSSSEQRSILRFSSPSGFEYNRPLVRGHSIHVDDFELISDIGASSKTNWLIHQNPQRSKVGSQNVIFPKYIKFNNIRSVNTNGYDLLNLGRTETNNYIVHGRSTTSNYFNDGRTNCTIELTNITTSPFPVLNFRRTLPYAEAEGNLRPRLIIDNLENLRIEFTGQDGDVEIRNSSIQRFYLYSDALPELVSTAPVRFKNCRITPLSTDPAWTYPTSKCFAIPLRHNITWEKCVFHLPSRFGNKVTTYFDYAVAMGETLLPVRVAIPGGGFIQETLNGTFIDSEPTAEVIQFYADNPPSGESIWSEGFADLMKFKSYKNGPFRKFGPSRFRPGEGPEIRGYPLPTGTLYFDTGLGDLLYRASGGWNYVKDNTVATPI